MKEGRSAKNKNKCRGPRDHGIRKEGSAEIQLHTAESRAIYLRVDLLSLALRRGAGGKATLKSARPLPRQCNGEMNDLSAYLI